MTGRNVDPYVAAEELRNTLQKKEEFLSGRQICSFFSRLCQTEKKTPTNNEAVKHKEMKDGIKIEVLKVIWWKENQRGDLR